MKVRYRCDEPMAKAKNVRRYCNKKCKECLCAISTDEWGREEHNVDLQTGRCTNISIRNQRTVGYYD